MSAIAEVNVKATTQLLDARDYYAHWLSPTPLQSVNRTLLQTSFPRLVIVERTFDGLIAPTGNKTPSLGTGGAVAQIVKAPDRGVRLIRLRARV
jgi:hypothetical protein